MSLENSIARREARRRKILENSENRLKRITGRNDTSEKRENPGVQLEDNGFVSYPNDIISNGTSLRTQMDTASCTPTSRRSEEDSYIASPISEQFDFLSSTSGDDKNGNSSLKNVTSLVTSNLIYISMAILFRFTIEFNSHFLCANSLVVAFILTKLAVCSLHGLPIPETSRFLGSILLLSGISTKKIKIFTLSLSVVYSGLHEFALCIFVFVFCDLFIKTYKSISHY